MRSVEWMLTVGLLVLVATGGVSPLAAQSSWSDLELTIEAEESSDVRIAFERRRAELSVDGHSSDAPPGLRRSDGASVGTRRTPLRPVEAFSPP